MHTVYKAIQPDWYFVLNINSWNLWFRIETFFLEGEGWGVIFSFLIVLLVLRKPLSTKWLFYFFGIAISVVLYVFLLIKVEDHAWNMMLVAILLLWSVTCCHGDTMQHLVLLDNLPPSFQQNSTPDLVITTNYSVSTILFI